MRPDPLTLGFDTSAAHCAVALLCGGTIVAERTEPMAKGQAERLLPLLEEILAEGGVGWGDLAGIGVGIGPGNFTGIRISVAAARGLAVALGIPALGVSGFEALAYGQKRPIYALIDARRDQVFTQVLRQPESDAPRIMANADAARLVADFDGASIGPGMKISAASIARVAAARRLNPGQHPRPAPLYVRAADAAPPRNPAPVLLPD